MSPLLQSLLGANVDGSGSSFHADGRRIRDQDDNLPIGYGGKDVYLESSTKTEAEVEVEAEEEEEEEAKSWGTGDWRVVGSHMAFYRSFACS
jgi:hypothetical protein